VAREAAKIGGIPLGLIIAGIAPFFILFLIYLLASAEQDSKPQSLHIETEEEDRLDKEIK
jgi:hypothetical protein